MFGWCSTAAAAASARLGSLQDIPSQQVKKEALNQVRRIFGAMSLPSEKGIQRIPINAAQLCQGLRRLGISPLTGCPHHAPMRGGEPRGFGFGAFRSLPAVEHDAMVSGQPGFARTKEKVLAGVSL